MSIFHHLLSIVAHMLVLPRAVQYSMLIATGMLLLSAAPVGAVTMTANTSTGLAYSPYDGIVPQDNDYNQSTTTGTTASASVDLSHDYSVDGYPTFASGTADATASETDLHASATLTATDFVPGLLGEGFSATSFASLSNDYTISTIESLFASAIFHLQGSLSVTGDLAAHVSLSAHSEQLFASTVTSSDGLVNIDEVIAAPALSPAYLIGYSVNLQTSVTGNLSSMTAGNHDGTADFGHTLTFLGFELYEDEAMTIPYTGAATITTGDGLSIPVVAAVPLPPAVWLLGSGLLTLLPAVRRRQK